MTDFGYISKSGFAEKMRVTDRTVDGWIRRHWTKGEQYKVVGHQTLVNIKKAEDWMDELNRTAPGHRRIEKREDASESNAQRTHSHLNHKAALVRQYPQG